MALDKVQLKGCLSIVENAHLQLCFKLSSFIILAIAFILSFELLYAGLQLFDLHATTALDS